MQEVEKSVHPGWIGRVAMPDVLRRVAVLSLPGFVLLLAAPLQAQQMQRPQMVPFTGAGTAQQATGTAPAATAGGYALSTQPSGNPYATGTISSSPYGGYALSTLAPPPPSH